MHLGSFKTPAKESDPRLMGPNFYYSQEDTLRALASRAGFNLTVLRPDAVVGYAVGTAMNLLMCIAIYAVITRELGLPLRFPSTPRAYDALIPITDAELLAKATSGLRKLPLLLVKSSTCTMAVTSGFGTSGRRSQRCLI